MKNSQSPIILTRPSCKKRFNDLTAIQPHRPALTVADLRVGSDAQGIVNGRAHVVGRVWIGSGESADGIGTADHLSAAYAGTSARALHAGRAHARNSPGTSRR